LESAAGFNRKREEANDESEALYIVGVGGKGRTRKGRDEPRKKNVERGQKKHAEIIKDIATTRMEIREWS